MSQIAKRLAHIEEYYFSKKLREVRGLIAQGRPIINMGIGSPDLDPPEAVVKCLIKSVSDQGAHQYQSYQGLPQLRTSMANFYKEKFGVHVDPNSEILPLMGSKEGIMHISMAFLNEGDEVLIPNPGYPTYTSVTKLVGARPKYYDLKEHKDWFPDLQALQKNDLKRVKLMWINYPHMPTGAVAYPGQLEALIAFARRHQIVLVNDNPYSFVLNDNPVSLMQLEGATDVALELNSLSKTFNMAGWRIGMLLGSTTNIEAVLKVKSNMDSGMFYGIQQGAIEALKSEDNWFKTMNSIYSKRRKLIYELADALHCTYDKKGVGMFVWARLPHAGINSEDFIDELLYKKNIFIAPGTIFWK